MLYLNGLAFPFDAPLARSLGGTLAALAWDALRGDRSAVHELRARLTARAPALPAGMADVVCAIQADPLQRMSQGELARWSAAPPSTPASRTRRTCRASFAAASG